ncbi:hypothetical protein [Streptomyces sp. N2A]|uniref:hypothetical protein n=1 Tax=Streptomyces sp. N2A TaxID=3073936 RepID=UPI0028701FEC|nr:hypothetical protein [Streptomyces sp. N2A]
MRTQHIGEDDHRVVALERDEGSVRDGSLDALLHQKHPDPQQVEEKKSELHKAQATLKNDEGQLTGFEEKIEAKGCR